ncbi:hypothetical protein [Microbulbifer sp. VAAF005]|uniref:hypothetical protein n=1 Tax=Microbulbifer sp. VAAF005 TaxID=3034230 RepID=UPI0024AC9C83|nr:hypothetical protein [Microbulbifer sp. VAAF005]WHI47342.1 hypothetical protein P0078_02880 [Microbulbifer sp. VAAF005]
MKYFSLLFLCFICVCVNSEEDTFESKFLSKSSSIIKVKVVSAKEKNFEYDGKTYTCGINYSARVNMVLKGSFERKTLEFSSPFSLDVGGGC